VDSASNVHFSIVPDPGFAIDKVYIDNINHGAIESYTFNAIRTNHTIFATFKPIMFTITATASANGNINPGTIQVPAGSDQMFEAIPSIGAHLVSLTVDGANLGAQPTYTFTNVQENHTIFAQFAKNQYQITTNAGDNGTITPANPMVEHGDNQAFTFTPITGYKVAQVLIDGVVNSAAALAGTYTFVNVTQPHTISVTFTKQEFTITATTSGSGDVAYNGDIIAVPHVASVPYDEHSKTYVFLPEEGYIVKQVLVDGVINYQAIAQGEYRFLDVRANHTIHVVFAPTNFTILATAGQGGFINPAGAVTVATGTDKTFTIAPAAGNKLVRVLVDNIDNPAAVAAGTYTFTEVQDNHTITAQFEKVTYDVTFDCETGAYATPVNGSVSPVEYGGKFMFVVDLAPAYSQSKFIVRANGMAINPVNGIYTLNNIMTDQNVTVTGVTVNQYKVTAKAGNVGGTINPAGVTVVNYGDDMTFNIIPDAKYKVDYLLINGISQDATETYTFTNIKADATIVAYFTLKTGIETQETSVITIFSYDKVVTILNKDFVPVKQVDILDMYGRSVWQGQALTDKTEITLNVAAGIYTVRIITDDNQQVVKKVNIN